MASSNLYLIGDVVGFSPHIGRLVSMMNYARHTTLEAVKGLTAEQLDHLVDEQSNSIGALLFHIGGVEIGYQVHTFFSRAPNADEMREWGSGFELAGGVHPDARGHDLEYYVGRLERVRATTLDELARRDDRWLDERTAFRREQMNNHFKWFHVIEEELNHRGQIRWLRKRLPA
jgi:uncharacterized damage-inducible protein DinB